MYHCLIRRDTMELCEIRGCSLSRIACPDQTVQLAIKYHKSTPQLSSAGFHLLTLGRGHDCWGEDMQMYSSDSLAIVP